MVVILPWILRTDTWGSVVSDYGVNRTWWYVRRTPLLASGHERLLTNHRGIFTPASLFNDLGFTLTPDSMVSFQKATVPLLLGTFLIIIGNTGFPCMLRLVIWLWSLCVPTDSGLWEELKFLLDHPRRCFTLLFPSRATWWLFWILVALNCFDLILFIALDVRIFFVRIQSVNASLTCYLDSQSSRDRYEPTRLSRLEWSIPSRGNTDGWIFHH